MATGGGQKNWTKKWLPDGLQTSRESIRTDLTLRNSLVTMRKSVNLTLWAKIDPQKSENRPSKIVHFFCPPPVWQLHAGKLEIAEILEMLLVAFFEKNCCLFSDPN